MSYERVFKKYTAGFTWIYMKEMSPRFYVYQMIHVVDNSLSDEKNVIPWMPLMTPC